MSQFHGESQFHASTVRLMGRDELLRFLHAMNLWPTIESAGRKFHAAFMQNSDDGILAPLTVTLNFDMTRAAIVSVPFCGFIAHETYAFVQLLTETVFVELHRLLQQCQPSVFVHKEQFHVVSRCCALPDLPELYFRQARQVYRKGLAHFRGVLAAHSDQKKFIRHSVWYCPRQCKVNTITRGESTGGPQCELCGADMSEYPRYRYMCNYVVVTMLPVESVLTPRRVGEIFRGVRMNLSGMTQLYRPISSPRASVRSRAKHTADVLSSRRTFDDSAENGPRIPYDWGVRWA